MHYGNNINILIQIEKFVYYENQMKKVSDQKFGGKWYNNFSKSNQDTRELTTITDHICHRIIIT